MTHQKGKAYRSKEEILQELMEKDHIPDSHNYFLPDTAIHEAMEIYATQEKDRQEGWTDEDMIIAYGSGYDNAINGKGPFWGSEWLETYNSQGSEWNCMQEGLIDALSRKYDLCTKREPTQSDQWRDGYQCAENTVIDFLLEGFGYDPKRLETNAHLLIRNLLAKHPPHNQQSK